MTARRLVVRDSSSKPTRRTEERRGRRNDGKTRPVLMLVVWVEDQTAVEPAVAAASVVTRPIKWSAANRVAVAVVAAVLVEQ